MIPFAGLVGSNEVKEFEQIVEWQLRSILRWCSSPRDWYSEFGNHVKPSGGDPEQPAFRFICEDFEVQTGYHQQAEGAGSAIAPWLCVHPRSLRYIYTKNTGLY